MTNRDLVAVALAQNDNVDGLIGVLSNHELEIVPRTVDTITAAGLGLDGKTIEAYERVVGLLRVKPIRDPA